MGPIANQMIFVFLSKIKQKLKKHKEPLKSILFVFIAHLLCKTVGVLSCGNVITEKAYLVTTIILCIVIMPVYFFVKCDPQRKWFYTLMSFIAHVVFSMIFLLFSINIYTGWEILTILFTDMALSISFGIIFVADIILNLRS